MPAKANKSQEIKSRENDQIDKSLKLIAKSSFIIFISLALSKILAYLYRVVIARHFDPEVYGRFSIALMLSGLFMSYLSQKLTSVRK